VTTWEFWTVANLAVLKSETDVLRHGFLESRQSPRLPLTGWVYLWTFTLPDQIADLSKLLESWRAFALYMRIRYPKWAGVRVFEISPGGRWHVHAVTVRRYDVRGVRQLAQRYGFGRVNVKRVPASKAAYIAKYLAKMRKHREAKQTRLAGCFGFKGVPLSSIVTKDTWRQYVLDKTPVAVGQFVPWSSRKERAMKIWLSEGGTRGKPLPPVPRLPKIVDESSPF